MGYLTSSAVTVDGPTMEVIAMPGMNDALSYIIFGVFIFAIIVFALFSAG